MNANTILAAIVLAIASGAGGFFYGAHQKNTEWQVRWNARDTADAEAKAEAEKKEREREQAWQAKIEEIQNANKKNLEDLRKRERDAAASRMRDAIEAARRRASAEAAATVRSSPSPIDMFAGLLDRVDELAGKFAAEADESRIRGLACEAAYDSTR